VRFLRLTLFPFSIIYWIGTFIRNKLYDWKMIKTVKLNIPVISIGNIKAGGTGKTPFTIFLAEYLLANKKRVAIVSRGYKKASAENIYMIEGKENSPSIEKLGDEPYLIFTRLKNISDNFVLVSGNKKNEIAQIAADKYKPDIIIVDDGFQHRKLYRNADIVLIENPNDIFDKLLLPAGNLRETKSALKRASLVIKNNKSRIIEINDTVSIKYVNKGYFDLYDSPLKPDNAVYTLCGIANPHSFYSLINRDKINILRKFEFADHYPFKEDELEKLFTGMDKEKVIVTTEKDFVKLKSMKLFNEYKLVYLKIDIQFKKGKDIFENKMKEIIL
jgi:tetraacyldisaccharide 4'-kinase